MAGQRAPSGACTLVRVLHHRHSCIPLAAPPPHRHPLAAAPPPARRPAADPAVFCVHRCRPGAACEAARPLTRTWRPQHQRPVAARAASVTEGSGPPPQPPVALSPLPATSTLQQLAAAAHDPATFAVLLRRLAEPGSVCTEVHVVAAWDAWQQQRHAGSSSSSSSSDDDPVAAAAEALAAVTQQQLLALTADQVAFVLRCAADAAPQFPTYRPPPSGKEVALACPAPLYRTRRWMQVLHPDRGCRRRRPHAAAAAGPAAGGLRVGP